MKDWFLAVLLVMIVINAFLFMALTGITARVNRQIQKFYQGKLELFNGLAAEKEERLEHLRSEIRTEEQHLQEVREEIASAVPVQEPQPPLVFGAPAAGYRNEDFTEQYRLVRKAFECDAKSVLSEVIEKEKQEEGSMALPYVESLLAKFPFETRYQIMTLPESDQLELVKEILSGEESSLLSVYLKEHEDFDVLSFLAEMENYRKEHGKEFVIRTGAGEKLELGDFPEEVRQETDENICEGFKVFYGSHMYDYSL